MECVDSENIHTCTSAMDGFSAYSPPPPAPLEIPVWLHKLLVLYLAANVHDLYKQASMETYGSFLVLIGIPIVAVVGAIIKMYFEGPSCPSSAKLTGTFPCLFIPWVSEVLS